MYAIEANKPRMTKSCFENIFRSFSFISRRVFEIIIFWKSQSKQESLLNPLYVCQTNFREIVFHFSKTKAPASFQTV